MISLGDDGVNGGPLLGIAGAGGELASEISDVMGDVFRAS